MQLIVGLEEVCFQSTLEASVGFSISKGFRELVPEGRALDRKRSGTKGFGFDRRDT